MTHASNRNNRRRSSTKLLSHRRPTIESLEPRHLLAFSPQLVADVNAVGANSTPNNFVAAAGTVFFHTSHFGHGMELWKTDGTTAGTVRVKQIEPNGDANIRGMIEFNDKLYFFAEDGINGTELWSSDGTEEGTQLVKDIFPGAESSNGSPHNQLPNFAVANGKLFFNAQDPEHGIELWQSDGTTAGTTLVADINPTGGSSPSNLIALGDKLLFYANDGTNGKELWISDGTTSGTTLVADVVPGPDGTNYPVPMMVVENTAFFRGSSVDHGHELWKTDGTAVGTMMVKDIQTGSASSSPGNFTYLNGVLIFSAVEADGAGLYRSDGTEVGTYSIKSQIGIFNFTVLGDKAYYIGGDSTENGIRNIELGVTDGTEAGTHMVADIFPGLEDGVPFPQGMAVLGNRIYFTGFTPETGQEFWVSDGTADGTRMIKDINPGPSRGMLYFGSESITAIGDKLYFGASDGVTGVEPWVSDGTTEGTNLLRDVTLGTSASNPILWTALGDSAVFGANDGVHGFEPWKTDGTQAGTILVKDIQTDQSQSSDITWSFGKAFESFNGNLFFTARDADSPVNGLWRTDGTVAGTTVVPSKINSSYAPQFFTSSGGQLFFKASDEGANTELWKSDGTEAGTILVKDIFPGSTTFPDAGSYINPSAPSDLVDVAGKLFFAATDANGRELWRTLCCWPTTLAIKRLDRHRRQAYQSMGQAIATGEGLWSAVVWYRFGLLGFLWNFGDLPTTTTASGVKANKGTESVGQRHSVMRSCSCRTAV